MGFKRFVFKLLLGVLLVDSCSAGIKGAPGGQRSPYDQSYPPSPVSRTPCDRPESPMNGGARCRIDRDLYECIGSCREGYKFPDGQEEIILTCSTQNGRWTPFPRFPDCVGSGGGSGSSYSASRSSSSSSSSSQGYRGSSSNSHSGSYGGGSLDSNNRGYTSGSSRSGSYGGGSLESNNRGYTSGSSGSGSYGGGSLESNNRGYTSGSSGSGSYGGGSLESNNRGYTSGSSGSVGRDSCGQPAPAKNAAFSCRRNNDEWTCTVTCNGGYQFADGSRQATHTCNVKDGRWYPKKEFDVCQLFFHPPCENGGRCSSHNQCLCPPTHRGIRCQYATSLCDVKRFAPGSFHTNCSHLPEYSECTITCPNGMSFDPPSTSMFRCTVNGLWNPPIPPRCREGSLCKQPPSPKNGGLSCQSSSSVMLCSATCRSGYTFPDNFLELASQCNKLTGQWTPTTVFPDCEAICSPPCKNNGRCIGRNSCLCPREFRGSQCEYPLSNCDGHDRFASVKWSCSMNSKETVCDVSCLGPTSKLQPPNPTRYTCSLDGSWQPNLKPICVEDHSSLIDARTERAGYAHSSNSYHSRGGSFDRKRQTGHELSEKRSMGHEFDGQKKMGHKFDGQRPMGHEFDGQRHGQEEYDWDDGGLQGQNPVDHEFVGHRQTENEPGRARKEIDETRAERLEEDDFRGGKTVDDDNFGGNGNRNMYVESDGVEITEERNVPDIVHTEFEVPNTNRDTNVNADLEIFSKKESKQY